MPHNPNGGKEGEELKLFTVFGEMDWELACHEVLNYLHHWFDLFRSVDPLANHSSDCRGDFHQQSFQDICLLKLDVPANIFLSSATFMALNSPLFFCFDILNLELFEFQRPQVMEKLYSNGNLKQRLVVCRRAVVV